MSLNILRIRYTSRILPYAARVYALLNTSQLNV